MTSSSLQPTHSHQLSRGSISSQGLRSSHAPQLSPSRDLFYDESHLRAYPHHHHQGSSMGTAGGVHTAPPAQQYANPLGGGMAVPSVPMHQQSAVGMGVTSGAGRGYSSHNRNRSMNGPSGKHHHYLSSSAVSGGTINGLNGRKRKNRRHGAKKGGRMMLSNKQGARPQVTGYISGGGSSNNSQNSIQSAPLSQNSNPQENQGGWGLSSIGSTAYGWLVGGGGNTETPGQ